jgi:hypothetical protein
VQVPQVIAGEDSLEAALAALLNDLGSRSYRFIDGSKCLENRTLSCWRDASSDSGLIKVNCPFPTGWVGRLDDHVFDSLVFHQDQASGTGKVA